MEKSKLLSLIKKIYKPNFSNLSPTDVYTYFVTQFPYKEFASGMKPEDIIMASYLLPMVDTPEVLDKQYDFIKSSLFGFTLIEVDSDYADVNCDYCNGDGYNMCDSCDGDGKIDCVDCGGDGEDGEGESCRTCDGEGKESCNDCDDDGTIACDYCDGSGSIDDYDKSEVSQWFFVSYDKTLLDQFLLLDEWARVKNEIMISKKSISLLRKQEIIDDPSEDIDSGEVYFYEVTEELSFTKTSDNRIDINTLSDVA